MNVPLQDQISCVRREIGLRRSVYPRLIQNKSMTQAWADYQIDTMTAVLETLEDLAKDQGELFPQEVTHEADHES